MLSMETINRLRVSGPLPTNDEISETRRVLFAGRLLWVGQIDDAPVKLPAVVWALFVEAMETHKRIPDRERSWLRSCDRVMWPTVIHSDQEIWEADLQRLIDLKMSKYEAPMPRLPNTDPSAIPRMLVVLGWLRFVRGTPTIRLRDRRMFMALAGGAPVSWVRNRFMGHEKGDRGVYAVKGKCCKQISEGISPYVDFAYEF